MENLSSQAVWFDDLEIATGALPTALVVQETHYDPWGLELSGIGYVAEASKEHDFKFQSKELVGDFGLGWYDFQWRQYDPVLGRFNSVDPLAHHMRRFSPFAFVFNNPLRFTDPDGMKPTDDYYAILNDRLVYMGNDGQGNAIRLVNDGRAGEAYRNLQGAQTTNEQREVLRGGEISQEVTFNETQVQAEFQGASDRTNDRKLENSVIITLDPQTATVSAQPGAEGTNTEVENTYITYGQRSGLWTDEAEPKLAIGDGHGHPPVAEAGKDNTPGYSKKDSQTAGTSGIPMYTIDSYSVETGSAATIHRALPRNRAGTNPVGTTQNTNNIGRTSFMSTAIPLGRLIFGKK